MSVPSPLKDPRLKELAFQTRFAAELLKAYNNFLAGVDEVKRIVQEAKTLSETANSHLARINRLPRGEKGDKGDRGPQGLPGKDGKDGISPDPIEVSSRILSQIKLPKDGRDGKDADEDKIVAKLIKRILKEKLLTKDHISGLMEEIGSYRHQMAMRQAGQHGGGMTLEAGPNITLTPQANGTVLVTAAGGGSGTNVVTQYTLTAVQAGSDVTIDLNQLTNYATFDQLVAVYRNNVPQTEGASYNFTVSGDTVTIFNAASDEIYNITYSYTS
jgi:hypothetical protein